MVVRETTTGEDGRGGAGCAGEAGRGEAGRDDDREEDEGPAGVPLSTPVSALLLLSLLPLAVFVFSGCDPLPLRDFVLRLPLRLPPLGDVGRGEAGPPPLPLPPSRARLKNCRCTRNACRKCFSALSSFLARTAFCQCSNSVETAGGINICHPECLVEINRQ